MRSNCAYCLNNEVGENPTGMRQYDGIEMCTVTAETLDKDELYRPWNCEHYREDIFLVRACRELPRIAEGE